MRRISPRAKRNLKAGGCLLLLIYSFTGKGQTDTVRLVPTEVLIIQDSIIVTEKDTVILLPAGSKYRIRKNQFAQSEQFFDSLHNTAYQNAVTRELYNLFVRYRPPEDIYTNRDPVKAQDIFKAFEGKTIASVEVLHVDLFAGSVTDTTIRLPKGSFSKSVADLHRQTRKRIIRNQLLFQVGDRADPYQLGDSERIVRSLRYIEDARLYLTTNANNLEEVHVLVVVKDRFPWGLTFSFSSRKKFRWNLTNRNILGSGNQLRVRYLYNKSKTIVHGYDVEFTSRNLGRTFTDFTAYVADSYQYSGFGASIKRDFVSPEIQYGGELSAGHETRLESITFADSVLTDERRNTNTFFDGWLARAFHLDNRTNLSISTRYWMNRFSERPEVEGGFNERFHNRDLLLTGLFLSRTNYYKTKNILNFNITEDVPVGFLTALIFGHDWAEFQNNYYAGFRVGAADIFDIGYFGFNVQGGLFFNEEMRSNQVINVTAGYFTPLFSLGRFSNRTLLATSFAAGRDLSVPLSVSLARNNRIRSINGAELTGDLLWSGSLETVTFFPGSFFGIRTAVVLFTDMGFVRETRVEERNHKSFYEGFGGGLRLRNESLVFDTFEFRAVYFPEPPPGGNHFRWRISFSTPLVFRNFVVVKPQIEGLENLR